MVNFPNDNHYDFLMRWGKVRNYQLYVCFFQITVYMVLCFQLLAGYKKDRQKYPEVSPRETDMWIWFNSAMGMLVFVVLAVKVSFVRDLGDHIIASFFTFIIYLATFAELAKLGHQSSMTEDTQTKDNQRAVSDRISSEKKDEIQAKLVMLMNEKKLYRDSLVSLARVAKQTGEPAYVVSQVINERMGESFFEWIARYRVEEAKRILNDPEKKYVTIEQVAEEVGYNSKSAFNKVFKKLTGKTPSEYKATDLQNSE
jgi:AraC-like DNA-binding protein